MLDARVRHRRLVLALALCLAGAGAVYAQQSDNISQKTSGTLSKLLRSAPTPTPTPSGTDTTSTSGTSPTGRDLGTRNKQKELPAVGFIFRTRRGAAFPEEFRRFVPVPAQAMPAGPVRTQTFSIAASNAEPLRLGVNVPDVIAIEIKRPPIIGPLMQIRPANEGARRSHKVDRLNAEYPDVNGSGVTAAIIDGGGVLSTHIEFRLSPASPTPNRVQLNAALPLSAHATHVAGTLGAFGRRAAAKGMAPGVSLISEDWWDDLTKVAGLAPTIQISNHSYGPPAGWGRDEEGRWLWWGDTEISKDEDARFGKYTSEEAQLDAVLYANPELLTFVAAGNDRDDGPPRDEQPILHYVLNGLGEWVLSEETRNHDGWKDGGLDTLVGLGVAKNAISIGAVDDIITPNNIDVVSFSGWGPTDDGRVKPDLVANGFQLLSTSNAGESQYVDMSGTSMASPTAAGIAALLVQLYTQARGRRPTAAEIKAVMIHTATDVVNREAKEGPDPVSGWGSIDALRAGFVIEKKDGDQSFRHVIKVDELVKANPNDPAPVKEYTLTRSEANRDPIKVTLVWTDPPGAANRGGLNDAAPVLVNDLDLTLVSPGPNNEEFLPYTLDRARPLEPARRDRVNQVDNVEVIERVGTMNGEWKIRVKGTHLRQGAGGADGPRSQRFALVVSGLK